MLVGRQKHQSGREKANPRNANHRGALAFLIVLALMPLVFLSGCSGLVSAGGNNLTPQITVQLSPLSLTFSNVVVGQKSSQTLSVTNTGQNSVTLTQATLSATQFSISGVTLPLTLGAGQTATLTVWFNSAASGNVTGTLGLNFSGSTGGSSSASVPLTANSLSTQPQLSVSPTSVNFGKVTTGTTATSGVTLTNSGSANLTISMLSLTGSTFGISGITTPKTIGAGQSATLNVTYSPTAANNDTGNISITSNDPVNPTTNIALSGTGSLTAVAPTITTQPASQTVTAGQAATFAVAASGTATLTYQWQKNGANISGANAASYTTPATATTDSGSTFRAVVSNTAGSVTSAAATLTVNAAAVAPTITTQPASQTVTAGQAATFTVAASGTATLTYQWQKNGANISGATAASYTTPTTATTDSGSTFRAVVSNTAGSVTSAAATLTVNAAAVAPTITTQPTSQTVTAGQTATFTVAASGTATLTYQWQKNGANISGASAASYTTPATATTDSGSTFKVVVSNSVGSTTSAAATLTVTAAAVAPTITTQPASQTVTSGQTATFTVAASGTATLNYQWQKNGANISGATSASYTTATTAASDNGSTFLVVVTNAKGSVTSAAATLTVTAAPVAGIQLSSSSMAFGNGTVGVSTSQALIITNSGTATLSITQINETGLAFGVSGYTLPLNVSAGQHATVTVAFLPTVAGAAAGNISIVSNAPTSPSAVTLSGTGVAATQTLSLSATSLSFGSVNTGTSTTKSFTITNTGNASVAISSITAAGAGYSITSGGSAVTLTPTQAVTVAVQFAPTTAGTLPGSVAITSNATGSPATVTLTGTGVTPVAHSATLSWTASSSTVVGYNVYRSTTSGSFGAPLNGSLVSGVTYADTTVVSGTTYFYVTTAVDGSGNESVVSNEVQAVIP
jgi:Abnormal spindle-like microcephaly-assoc'd, ASPM-SPD-2-Hydin/Immunoglobulin domain/Immunoglobulin I-set domain